MMEFPSLLVFKVSTANQDLIQLVEVVQTLQQLCLLNFKMQMSVLFIQMLTEITQLTPENIKMQKK